MELWQDTSLTVSWGTLRGKIRRATSKNAETPTILCLHGYLDNCQSFLPLIPFLPLDCEIVCLDLPGHGFSDHIPKGMKYDSLFSATTIAEGLQNANYDKVILIGHSFGGFISTLIAAAFPKLVKALILLDFWSFIERFSVQELQRDFSKVLYLNKSSGSKHTTWEAAKKQMIESRQLSSGEGGNTGDAEADILLQRHIREDPSQPGKYLYTFDKKIQVLFRFAFDGYFHKSLLSSVNVPVCTVHAKDGLIKDGDQRITEMYKNFLENVKHLHRVLLPGNHHVHMTHPEVVCKHINAFLYTLNIVNAPLSKL